jgi:XTP/dITP diphosphohydrolase
MSFRLKGKVVFFATNNVNKFNEVRRLLTEHRIAVGMLRVKALEIQSESLMEISKASVVDAYARCHLPVVVEDTGLFVKALNGFPGPYAAYVYKTIGNVGLLQLMKKAHCRDAFFESVVAYCDSDQACPMTFVGKVNGEVANEEKKARNESAFGFDPVFRPVGADRTFAEMSAVEKNCCSHRAEAFGRFARWYKRFQR